MDLAGVENEIERVVVTEQELQAKIKELAARIDKDYAGKDLLLIGVLKGAVMAMADLSRALARHVEMDWMAVSSYGSGTKSSGVVRILKDLDRDSFYLADKLPIWSCKTPEDVDRIFHEQLEKCGVEYFDFYLIHAVNKDRIQQVEDLDLFTMLETFKKEGKIRNIGFSFHDDLEAFKKLHLQRCCSMVNY